MPRFPRLSFEVQVEVTTTLIVLPYLKHKNSWGTCAQIIFLFLSLSFFFLWWRFNEGVMYYWASLQTTFASLACVYFVLELETLKCRPFSHHSVGAWSSTQGMLHENREGEDHILWWCHLFDRDSNQGMWQNSSRRSPDPLSYLGVYPPPSQHTCAVLPWHQASTNIKCKL